MLGPLFGRPSIELAFEIVNSPVRGGVSLSFIRVLCIGKVVPVSTPYLARAIPRTVGTMPRTRPAIAEGARRESIGVARARFREK